MVLEKRSASVTLKRPLSTHAVFQTLDNGKAVQCCFAGKKPAFSPMIVVSHVTCKPEPSSGAGECYHSRVGDGAVTVEPSRIMGKVQAGIAVSHE